MRGIRELLGLLAPLAGLEAILDQVANGQLTASDAAAQIRNLASRPHIPQWIPRIFRIMGGNVRTRWNWHWVLQRRVRNWDQRSARYGHKYGPR